MASVRPPHIGLLACRDFGFALAAVAQPGGGARRATAGGEMEAEREDGGGGRKKTPGTGRHAFS
jgi:hypothetical protein